MTKATEVKQQLRGPALSVCALKKASLVGVFIHFLNVNSEIQMG